MPANLRFVDDSTLCWFAVVWKLDKLQQARGSKIGQFATHYRASYTRLKVKYNALNLRLSQQLPTQFDKHIFFYTSKGTILTGPNPIAIAIELAFVVEKQPTDLKDRDDVELPRKLVTRGTLVLKTTTVHKCSSIPMQMHIHHPYGYRDAKTHQFQFAMHHHRSQKEMSTNTCVCATQIF